jgi:alanine racemase
MFLEYGVDITASSVSKLEQIEGAAKAKGVRAKVHIKIDTGLERIGTHYYSCQEFLERAAKVKYCDVVGIYSHFAAIEPNDVSLGELQLARFNSVVEFYAALKPRPFLRHISASTGILGLPSANLDMVRPGLILYGVYPDKGFAPQAQLRPALSLKSRIVFFKVVKEGAGVSYSHTWHAPYDTRIVTIPIGYGDGYLRALSNKGIVLVRGKRAPVVGNVCMDQLMADIGPTGIGYNGDEVVLIGSQGEDAVTVEELALRVGTAPHEILTLLNQRIPRRYVD